MTKGSSTLLFLLAATAANVVSTALIFAALLALYAITLAKVLPPDAVGWAVTISFVGAMAGSALLYRFAIRKAREKWNLDAFLGPDRKR